MYRKISLLLLRVGVGTLFLYAGITKVADPTWSAKGYLMSAKTFSWFYTWLASDAILPFINFLNAWRLTLLGAALMLGVFIRWSGILGAALMVLYYFPALEFPFVPPHAYLVDEHIVYTFALLLLSALSKDNRWGMGEWIRNLPCCGGAKKEKGDAPVAEMN